MKKFTTILAAASLMLAGLASCNAPGPQPQPDPPVPEATWDEKVGEWLEGTNFTGELPLPIEALEGLEVTVAEAEGKINVSIANLEATVPEPEEGEEEQGQPKDYYTVLSGILNTVFQGYTEDDEEGTFDEGTIDLLTKFDADGDFATLHLDFYAPYMFYGILPVPGEIQLTWGVEKALTAAQALTTINNFVAGNGVENSNPIKEGSDLTEVGSFFRLKEYTYNAYEEAIAEVAELFEEDYAQDGAGDFYTTLLWNYASETTEAEALGEVVNELIDELYFVKTMENPVVSMNEKGEQFTYITMSEGKYNRVNLIISASTFYNAYYEADLIGITIYGMPSGVDPDFDGEVTEAVVLKTFSKPEGPGVVPAEDALLNVLDVDAPGGEGKWTYTAKYKGVGNLIETKAANAAGDTINGNFFEQSGQLTFVLQVEGASQTNTSAIATVNTFLANCFGEGVGFTVGLPDLTTVEPTGLNTKMRTITDHEGNVILVLQYNDYYPKSGFDPEDTKTYAQRWVELLAEQTYDPDGDGEQEAVAAWTTPESRGKSGSGEIWACYGVERVTVGTGMDAKDKRVNLLWLAGPAQFVLQISVDDAPAAWDVETMNKLTSDAGFTTEVPHVDGEYFFNLDQYLAAGQFVCYAPDSDGTIMEAFVEQFVCYEPNDDEADGLALARDPEPEKEPEWIDESFDYSGMWVNQFVSIEVVPALEGFDAEFGGKQISVQAYTQNGISYFIVEVEQTTTNSYIVSNYINNSLAALGWDGEFDPYWADYLVENGAANLQVVTNQPYDPVEGKNFVFQLAFLTRYGSYIMDLNDEESDVIWYVESTTCLLYAGSRAVEEGTTQYTFYFADEAGEYADGMYLKYGSFIVTVNTNYVLLTWNVGKNQNAELDISGYNAFLESEGFEFTIGDPTEIGPIFAQDQILDWYMSNFVAVRVVDDHEAIGDLVNICLALFANVPEDYITIDQSNWNSETLTGTINIYVWYDPSDKDPDYGTTFKLTIKVTVAKTDSETGDPIAWRVELSGGFTDYSGLIA